jgi:aspartyl-tRNA(Asn)/glutamyl-tRNA(Gln) amidotransferase subunit A
LSDLSDHVPVTIAEWQQFAPEAAAHEVMRRVALLSPGQQKAVIAGLVPEPALIAAFSASSGPLRGVPYLAKDLFDVPDMPTFAGSTFLPEVRKAPATASKLIRDIAASGAVLAGKTQTFEFAWGLTGENAHYGDCEHPRFPGRTSGGSSSGSAAAVGAGIVPFAIGTDTGGSIRVPAAFCGIYGYRCIPRDDWIADAVPLAPNFDTAGWFTGTAADMRTTLSALVDIPPATAAPRGCYLAMSGVEPEVAAACRAASLAADADRATASELSTAFASAAEVYGVLAGVESWKIHRKWAERNRARYGPLLQERLDRARAISPAQVAAVEPSFHALNLVWKRFFQAYDYLIMPAVPFPALAKADCTHANRLRMLGLTAPASMGGLSVLTIPVPLASGMSAGLQVIVESPRSAVIGWALDQVSR